MATYERRPQKMVDWLAAGNTLPEFAAGRIEDALTARGIALQGVSVSADGTVTIAETDATTQKLVANLDAIEPDTLDPERGKETEYAGIMAQLDAFATAVDGGQAPTAAQTQATVARLVRVVQYLAERRR